MIPATPNSRRYGSLSSTKTAIPLAKALLPKEIELIDTVFVTNTFLY